VIFQAKSAHLFSNLSVAACIGMASRQKKGEFQKQWELLKFPELSFYHF